MKECFFSTYNQCSFFWSDITIVLFWLNIFMGISQYFLSRKLRVAYPYIALIPIINILNLILLSGISWKKFILPWVFLVACIFSYNLIYLDPDSIISLSRIAWYLLFYIWTSFWIIYFWIIIAWEILNRVWFWNRIIGYIWLTVFWPIFIIYLALKKDDPISSDINMINRSENLSEWAKDSLVSMDTWSNDSSSKKNDNNPIVSVFIWFAGIIGTLFLIGAILFWLFILCIVGGPPVCVFGWFWH